MEFVPGYTKLQIASLVLGYLKSEKCYKAFNEFLDESEFFQKHKNDIKIGKYFVATRVGGMSLLDLLEEYAAIYSLVQARLEASSYYEEHAKGSKANLVEQILYLLDRSVIANSTPFSVRSEVETTPVHTLPGHNGSEGSDDSSPKTPKRRTTRSRSTNTKNVDKDEAFDVSEVLTQTLLENHELHEKIAETINIVRNTPEVAKTVTDEHISAGASKELDAIIKTVVQRTEEDPLYNKLIDEIIGTAPFDNGPIKKTPQSNSTPTEEPRPKRTNEKSANQTDDRIEDHNNDAVRSIIAAAQNPAPQPPPPPPEENKSENGEVYVFDGTLDNYLKSSGGTSQVTPNPVYINTGGGLIVMPPEPPKQFYIVNNQPLINMNVSTVKSMITDSDIMAMPTIIVNDETQTTFTNQTYPVTTATNKNPPNKRNKTPKIMPKPVVNVTEILPIEATPKEKKKNKTTKDDPINSVAVMASEPKTVTASKTTPSSSIIPTTKIPTPRHASHVRNLDFSTPNKGAVVSTPAQTKAWDADLRSLIANKNTVKSPTPKRKRPVAPRSRKKAKAKNKFEEKLEETKEKEDEEETEIIKIEEEPEEIKIESEKKDEEEKENQIVLATPTKNTIPKTPGAGGCPSSNSFHCTPFNDVLEEHLKGVDLISLPTPKLPITPGFAITPGLSLASGLGLTPADMIPPYNNRSTDYSTSSSYYQPSDTEQNKSLDQLIEECKKLEKEKISPPIPPSKPDKFSNLKILSDVVIQQAKVSKKKEEHLKKFNHHVIGKKNLNLLNPATSSSSPSESSDSESEKSPERSNNTIIQKKETKKTDPVSISSIISTMETKNTLNKTDEETRKKNILSHLETVRQRTINKLKAPTEAPKKTPGRKKQATKITKKKTTKKKNSPKAKQPDEEAQKLVTDLAQRGIHLIPNKTPKKKKIVDEDTLAIPIEQEPPLPPPLPQDEQPPPPPPPPPPTEEEEEVLFDTKTYQDYHQVIVHEEKRTRAKNTKTYNLEVLKKGFEAKLYVEELQKEVIKVMRATDFKMLADISPRKKRMSEEDAENDFLMDYVFIGSVQTPSTESPETKQPKGGKKRKSRSSETDDCKQTEKKCKTLEKNIKLLKKIDVDSFLDKVHGE